MSNIFERNYKAVVNRGLIKPETTDWHFYLKLIEETDETVSAMGYESKDRVNEEIADCLNVCANWLIHRGVNIEEILTSIAEKNEARKV